MLYNGEGILIRKTKYSESSVVITLFTKDKGIQAFMIKGAYKKGKNKSSHLLSPLNQLEFSAYPSSKGTLELIKSISLKDPYKTINIDVVKSSLAFFLCDVINHTIKENETNPKLYDYLTNCFKILDVSEDVRNFHLLFLTHLTKFLGFFPDTNKTDKKNSFDLENGTFVRGPKNSANHIDSPQSDIFSQLLGTKFDALGALNINKHVRRELLTKMLKYYKFHIESFDTLKSLRVIETVLHS